tara:strand:- start:256 stop:459 length:204 start_codon:yes stop_codon:yes gene_type:complete
MDNEIQITIGLAIGSIIYSYFVGVTDTQYKEINEKYLNGKQVFRTMNITQWIITAIWTVIIYIAVSN